MVVRKLISAQVQLSRRVERLLPEVYRKDGHLHYTEEVVPKFLRQSICVYDVGGANDRISPVMRSKR